MTYYASPHSADCGHMDLELLTCIDRGHESRPAMDRGETLTKVASDHSLRVERL